MSYVYAIGGKSGLIKIGKSSNPSRRLRDLQVGSPVLIYLIASAKESSLFNEKLLHRLLKSRRSHHEWFDINKELVRILFFGDPRVTHMISLSPRKLFRLHQAFGESDISSLIVTVANCPLWLWDLSLKFINTTHETRLARSARRRRRNAPNAIVSPKPRQYGVGDRPTLRLGSLAGPVSNKLSKTGETLSAYVRRLVANDLGRPEPKFDGSGKGLKKYNRERKRKARK